MSNVHHETNYTSLTFTRGLPAAFICFAALFYTLAASKTAPKVSVPHQATTTSTHRHASNPTKRCRRPPTNHIATKQFVRHRSRSKRATGLTTRDSQIDLPSRRHHR